MSDKKLSWVIHGEADKRQKMLEAWEMMAKGLQSGSVVLTLSRETRSTQQNALMWSLLTEVSNQVDWYGQKLSPDDWKNVCTASLTKQQAVPGIEGGVVMLGRSTRKMSKAEFSELIELIYAFGSDHGVTFSDKVSKEYGEWLESIK